MLKHKYLVFSSVGDYHALAHWTRGERNFDLWVAHYGDKKLADDLDIDLIIDVKGAKFPNFKYFYQQYESILKKYDAIALLDDDLILSTADINTLFAIRASYQLWILQPAFSASGKISHTITQEQTHQLLRTTNFVEVTCPFFQTDHLLSFMDIYDPVLVGFGVDWWFLHHLNAPKGKIAIVDAVTCINPLDVHKPEGREIDRLQSLAHRRAHWHQIKTSYGIKNEGRFVQYGAIANNNNKKQWLEWVCKSP